MQKLAVVLAFLFAWYPHLAQPSNASFLHYTTDQGLSNDHITGIVKDHLGFLWISTVNGLNRFDGRNFKMFRHNPTDEHSLPDDFISGITLSPDHWLWIATGQGLCRIDPVWLDVERILLPENSDTLDNDYVTVVAFDSKGIAWTTTHRGIYSIDGRTAQLLDFFPTEQKTLGWYGMLIDKQDRLWLMKDVIRRFDPATQTYKYFKGVDNEQPLGALSLVMDSAGDIWGGTWSYGIWKYEPSRDEFEHVPGSPPFAMMLLPDVNVEGRKIFWVGGGMSGVGLYDPIANHFREFIPDPQDPYTHNNYLGKFLFKDPTNDDVWIGTEVGLEHYAPSAIRFGRAIIPQDKDMGQFSLVSGVVRDRTDAGGQRYFITVWGTGFFEWQKNTGKFTRMQAPSQITGPGNFNLFQDSNGNIWVCMRSGMGRYHPGKNIWRDYTESFQYPERNNLFWCGLEDRNGMLWFGSNREGLFRYNDTTDRIERVLYQPHLADENGIINIVDITEDTLGRLWLACGPGNLIRYNPGNGEARQFSYAAYDVPLACSTVKATRTGRIYAGFSGTFVELDMDGQLLRAFNQQNGLRTNRIRLMQADNQNNIWFTSEYLLHFFDPVTGTFNYYGKPDGLFSNAMTDALNISPDGEIFVGFQNAFNFFYPDRLRRNMQPPPIAITSIKVMNKERQVGIHGTERDTFLTLKPNEDFFEVEFAALSFNQQERNRYAYKLEGFNKEWVYTNRPVATFTNLDGGTYFLHMKAANNDGVWNEKGVALEIRVNPPFYKTWWFSILSACAIGCILAGLLWFRRQQRRRLEKFRESLARDLHDEMGSTLSSIRFFSEFAHQQIGEDKPQVTPMLKRISESATNLSESMQDIIWAMKTENDQLEDLAAHMTEFGLRLFEARNGNFKTNISEEFSGKQLKPEVRRNLYLIFKEAVNNAAKYAEASEVELAITLKKGLLVMNIMDNGIGFEVDSSLEGDRGNGLRNMRQRAEDIGGRLEIVSRPGEGTVVEVRIQV